MARFWIPLITFCRSGFSSGPSLAHLGAVACRTLPLAQCFTPVSFALDPFSRVFGVEHYTSFFLGPAVLAPFVPVSFSGGVLIVFCTSFVDSEREDLKTDMFASLVLIAVGSPQH